MKSMAKISIGQLIENQSATIAAAPMASAPGGSARPGAARQTPTPFSARAARAALDPRGGGPRAITLPLCVTPFFFFKASEGRA